MIFAGLAYFDCCCYYTVAKVHLRVDQPFSQVWLQTVWLPFSVTLSMSITLLLTKPWLSIAPPREA